MSTSKTSIKTPSKVASKTTSNGTGNPSTPTNQTTKTVPDEKDEAYFITPEFIYGGPFIPVKKPSPFIDSITPMNIPLQGTFTRSFAYFTLKDRLPVIITQVIDDISKKGGGPDAQKCLEKITKMKNDLMTNKDYDPFTIDTPEGQKWNNWIENLVNKKYYNNTWLFTECYVYRRLYEACELTESLKSYDYFAEKKQKSFLSNLKPMCRAAEKVVPMLSASDKDKRKADLMTLLKLALWANKCDLSLSVGADVTLGGPEQEETAEETPPTPPPPAPPAAAAAADKGKKKGKDSEPPKPIKVSSEPFQMILDLKDKLLVDDSGKIADQIVTKAENMQKNIEANTVFKQKCSCHRLAKSFGVPLCEEEAPPPPPPPAEGATEEAPAEPELPKIPCPAKMSLPHHVMFDVVCDNAGYELFADLCFATFLLEQKIVQRVRFHVKKMPWFVSDVTTADFKFVIESAAAASFSCTVPGPPGPEGNVEMQTVTAENLNTLGKLWSAYIDSGQFVVMDEDYWTYPHPYCEMRKYDYNMYRKLQYAVGILFKGDLNYRKLLADRNVNPYTALEPNLQGFIPAPIIAVRTVKSELVCGLAKGKFDLLNKQDPNWMRTGDYGVIQFCAKAEPLKAADRPCIDYCSTCFGVICAEHDTDM